MSTTSARPVITNLDTVLSELGPEVHAEVTAAIAMWWEANDPEGDTFDCTDNFRLALCGDSESELTFQDAQASGCCGAIDTVFGPLPSGYSFMWGFNYGH